jgi:hypothetical protein
VVCHFLIGQQPFFISTSFEAGLSVDMRVCVAFRILDVKLEIGSQEGEKKTRV